MQWLRRQFHGREADRDETAGDAPGGQPEQEQLEPDAETAQVDGARLMLLVHDAAGPASYKLHVFQDATEAAEFVEFWFPPELRQGIPAFWATHGEPEAPPEGDGRPAEVMVLIRDEETPGLVYPFSCQTTEGARERIAMEAAQGLDANAILIYWATPVEIKANRWGRVQLTPEEPPTLAESPAPARLEPSVGLARFKALTEEAARESLMMPSSEAVPSTDDVEEEGPDPNGPKETKAKAEPEPAEDTQPSGETLQVGRNGRGDKKAGDETEPNVIPIEEQPALRRNGHGHDEADEELALDEVSEEERPALQVGGNGRRDMPEKQAPEAANAAERHEEGPNEPLIRHGNNGHGEAATEELADYRLNEDELAEEQAAEQDGSGKADTDATHAEPMPEWPAHKPRPQPATPTSFKPVENEGPERGLDPLEELRKVIKKPRWDRREGPFEGFKSPPGRF